MLAIPLMKEAAAAKLASAEGVVCHLTSLVLVDETGRSPFGIAVRAGKNPCGLIVCWERMWLDLLCLLAARAPLFGPPVLEKGAARMHAIETGLRRHWGDVAAPQMLARRRRGALRLFNGFLPTGAAVHLNQTVAAGH